MRELALFAGSGGGILGGHLLGWRTVCAVEINPYCAGVLCARQNEGFLPPFPIWDDVRTFDGKSWRGIADVVSGGFPCQDISVAGKGEGIDGKQSGLWKEMARIVGEVRPPFVFVENSPALVIRGLGTVLGDLAAMGYDAKWGVLGADNAGAPHRRKRIWILAHTCCDGCNTGRSGYSTQSPAWTESHRCHQQSHVAHTNCKRLEGPEFERWESRLMPRVEHDNWWDSEPDVGRVADGVAARVDRLRALGNGQVPAVAKIAWEILANNEIGERHEQN